MIESTDWNAVGVVVGCIISFIALIAVPAAIMFHRKIIRPLSWVLGVEASDSPTGEAVLPVPQQLAELRRNQREDHRVAVSTNRMLREHLTESDKHEADIWSAIHRLGGEKVK